ARLGSLTALVFVAPLLSPITVALTWSLLGWRMTVARVIAALLGSSLLGAVINRYEAWFEATRRPMIAGASPELDLCYETHAYEQNGAPAAPGSVWQQLAVNLRHITCRVVPYFIAGIALAAAVSTLLPDDAIPRALGGAGGVSAYLLAAVAGAPLYVCQGEEVPLTYAVLASGVSPGPALTFLLGAVGMCLPTVVMSRGVLAPRVTYFYVAFWIAFVILAGVTFQALSG
ncbi:MAG: permease, partial [Solirubrobacteraceae bacterium]